MINPKKIKKKQALHILSLFEEMTRAEIMARHGYSKGMEFGDYAMMQIEKMDELRKYIYGTDDLIALGFEWGILHDQKDKKRRARKSRRPS